MYNDKRKFPYMLRTYDQCMSHKWARLMSVFISGLCGSFDKDRDNDLTTADGTVVQKTDTFANDFSLSWRYTISTSKALSPISINASSQKSWHVCFPVTFISATGLWMGKANDKITCKKGGGRCVNTGLWMWKANDKITCKKVGRGVGGEGGGARWHWTVNVKSILYYLQERRGFIIN